jgi:uncharacterized protein YciI
MKGMRPMDKCKFCRAKELFKENGYTAFGCGAHRYGADEWGQSVECLSRQLAQSESMLKALCEGLEIQHIDILLTMGKKGDFRTLGKKITERNKEKLSQSEARARELEAAARLLIAVHDYHEAAMIPPHPDAPGHAHCVSGHWDRDGSECEWCETWNQVREFVHKRKEATND